MTTPSSKVNHIDTGQIDKRYDKEKDRNEQTKKEREKTDKN